MLVLGAAGGVGLAAIELGKAFGARVVAAVSSEEKAAAAQRRPAPTRRSSIARAPFDKDAVEGAGRAVQGGGRPATAPT